MTRLLLALQASALLVWLLALPPVLDGHGNPIRRSPEMASIFALVASETDNPTFWAAAFDTFAALESNYRPHVAGDCKGLPPGSPLCTKAKANSYGLFQTPVAETSEDPVAQTRWWLALAKRTMPLCPAHPFSPLMTGGKCIAVGGHREAVIRAAVAVPVTP